nr:hypothetical protein CFP56_03343 [Quercus suber]
MRFRPTIDWQVIDAVLAVRLFCPVILSDDEDEISKFESFRASHFDLRWRNRRGCLAFEVVFFEKAEVN